MIIEALNIKKMYRDRVIFQIDKVQIHDGDRIGIVGKNGSGKTTLVKVLSGNIKADEGVVRNIGSNAYITQIEEDFKDTKSGGEKTIYKIRTALSKKTQLIFADEPTSNLDIDKINWVEDEFKKYRGALVLISHDREFLDNLCTKIWEIEDGKLNEHHGNYSSYLHQKKEKLAYKKKKYEEYVSEKKRLEEAVYDRENRASNMKKAPSRMGNSEARLHKGKKSEKQAKLQRNSKVIESRLEKLEKVEKPVEHRSIKFDILESNQLHSKVIVKYDDIRLFINDRVLIKGGTLIVKNKKKVAVIGNNGCGKTTLLKNIINKNENIEFAHGVKIGYFSQNLDILNSEKTIIENVYESTVYKETTVRTTLARLLFKGEDINKKVSVLSGGEKVKVAFAKVFLSDMNVLVMDEPTNYLDIESIDALADLLITYEGTVIFVSHNRHFVKKIADKVMIIEHNELKEKKEENTKAANYDVDKENVLKLEIKLTEIIGKLSMPSPKDDIKKLDEEYKFLLKELNQLRNKLK